MTTSKNVSEARTCRGRTGVSGGGCRLLPCRLLCRDCACAAAARRGDRGGGRVELGSRLVARVDLFFILRFLRSVAHCVRFGFTVLITFYVRSPIARAHLRPPRSDPHASPGLRTSLPPLPGGGAHPNQCTTSHAFVGPPIACARACGCAPPSARLSAPRCASPFAAPSGSPTWARRGTGMRPLLSTPCFSMAHPGLGRRPTAGGATARTPHHTSPSQQPQAVALRRWCPRRRRSPLGSPQLESADA